MALRKKDLKEEELPFPVEVVTDEEIQTDDLPTTGDIAMPDEPEIQRLPDYAILNPEIPMSVKVGVATTVANTLAPLVRTQGLVVKGLNRSNKEAEYVTVEGWEVLGTFLGIVPVTTVIDEIKNDEKYNKKYEPSSIVIFFFIFSFIGWLWEVSLFLFCSKSFFII